MIQRQQEPVEYEPILDPQGRELWLPSELVLVVCSLCDRFCTVDVPIWCRDVVRLYEKHRMLAEKAARPLPSGRPQCRECLAYNSTKPNHHGNGAHLERAALADQRMKE